MPFTKRSSLVEFFLGTKTRKPKQKAEKESDSDSDSDSEKKSSKKDLDDEEEYNGLYVGSDENVAGEAIYDAVAANDNKTLKKLCKEWGEIDAAINWRSQDDEYKFTPLLIGCYEEGLENCVKTLLKQKAIDINLPDADGRTPIWWAASEGRDKVVKILLEEKSIDVNKKPNRGDKSEHITPEEIAQQKNHTKIVEMFKTHSDTSTKKKGMLSGIFGRGGTVKKRNQNKNTKKKHPKK